MKFSNKLIEANIDNLISLWQTVGSAFEGFYHGEYFDYCAVEESDWPNKLWFNQDINEDIVSLAREKIASMDTTVGIPYWDIYNSGSYEQLEAAGFVLQSEQTGMVLELDSRYPVEADLTVSPLSTEEEAYIWAELYPQAFDYYIRPQILMRTLHEVDYYLIFSNGRPIGTTILYRQDDVAGIHGVGIIPTMRRRGFAEEIMKRLLNQLLDSNIEYVVLQASAMGLKLYEKLGFEEQFVMRNYNLQKG